MFNLNAKLGFFTFILVVLLPIICKGYQLTTLSELTSCDSINHSIQFTDFTGTQGIPDTFTFSVNNEFESLGVDVFIESISFKIQHFNTVDLSLGLISPSGIRVILFENAGDFGPNFGDLATLELCDGLTYLLSSYHDDYCNAIPIENGSSPFIGNYISQDQLENLYDDSNPNGEWKLLLWDDFAQFDGNLLFFDIQFAEAKCSRPIIESVSTNIDGDVELEISDQNNCSNLFIEWGAPGFTPGSDETIGSNSIGGLSLDCSNPIVLTDLEGLTDYDIYVRRKCSIDTPWSDNSCAYSFTTDCSRDNPTFISDFNLSEDSTYIPACGEDYEIPGEWRNYASGDRMDWGIHAGAPNIGTNSIAGSGSCLYLDDKCPGRDSTLLYSPCINVNASDPQSCDMVFDLMLKKKNRFEFFKLQISTDNGFTYSDLWIADLGNSPEAWERIYLDLSAYDGLIVQFRFFSKRKAASGSKIYLDNIIFYNSLGLGFPDNSFFVDQDLDGFGGKDSISIPSCAGAPIQGFSATADDCNDSDGMINPLAEELPCNTIDEDCNDNTLGVDLPIPNVPFSDTIICSGTTLNLSIDNALYPVLWYDSQNSLNPIFDGDEYLYTQIHNVSNDTLRDTIYLEFNDDLCVSVERAFIEVLILPEPNLEYSTVGLGSVCYGDTVNLANLTIQDANSLSQELLFYKDEDLLDEITAPYDLAILGEEQIWLKGVSSNGCHDVEPLILTSSDSLGLVIDGDTEVCVGSLSSISYQVSTDADITSTLWSTGSNDLIIEDVISNPLESVLYWVRVEDENGCKEQDSLLVTALDFTLELDVTVMNLSDCNATDGQIAIVPFGSNSSQDYNYILTGSDGTEKIEIGFEVTFEGLPGGTYELYVEDADNDLCFYSYPELLVINGGNVTVNSVEVGDLTCNASGDGFIKLDVSGNNPEFEWSNNDSEDSMINDLQSGFYSVTITDGNCPLELDSLLVSEPDPLEITIFDIKDTVSCFGSEDGFINVLVSGGSGPYTYNWFDQSEESSVSGLSSDNYGLTVSDSKSCEVEELFTISEPNPIQLSADIQLPTCHDKNDGQIILTASGGSGSYQYFLDGLLAQSNLSNLSSGAYSIQIKDNRGCEFDTIIEIPSVVELQVQLSNLVEPTCYGLADGQIEIEATGGHGGYSISWEDDNESFIRTDLSSGNYFVTVEDDLGCQILTSFELENSDSIGVDWVLDDATCSELSDGTISFFNPIGDEQLNYQLFFEGDELEQDKLPEGILELRIGDNRGCMDTFFIDHKADTAFHTIVSIINPDCKGKANGQISLGLDTMGVFPYSVTWSNDLTSGILSHSDLIEGTYNAVVHDGQGCIEELELNLESISDMTVYPIVIDSVSCTGNADANLIMEVQGGIEPFEFTWNNLEKSKNLINVGPNTYILSVKDSLGCAVLSDSIVLEPVQAMTTVLDYIYDDSFPCENKPLDTLKVSVAGGRAPYTISWSDGTNGDIYANPAEGFYDVEVSDDFGCYSILEDVRVRKNPELLEIEYEYLNNNSYSCEEGLIRDSVKFELLKGQLPLTFDVIDSNASLVESQEVNTGNYTFNSSVAGIYTVEVVDLNGCKLIFDDIDLKQIPVLSFDSISIEENKCSYDAIASIDFSHLGGLSPYEYTLYGELGTVQASVPSFANLLSGTYELVLKDSFNCIDSVSVLIPTIDPIVVDSIYFGGQNFCFGDSNVYIDSVSLSEGHQSDYELIWSSGQSNLSSGGHTLTVVTDEGCQYASTFQVGNIGLEPLVIDENTSGFEDPNCLSEPNGVINLNPVGGILPYSFYWSNLTNNTSGSYTGEALSLDDLEDGQYSIEVYDANLCLVEDSPLLNIELSDDNLFEPEVIFDPVCFNEPANIKFDFYNGQMPFSINWGDEAIEDIQNEVHIIPNLIPDTYNIEVSDATGCKVEFDIDLMLGDSINYTSYIPDSASLIVNFDDNQLVLDYSWAYNENITFISSAGEQTLIQFSELDTFLLIVTDTVSNCNATFEFNLFDLLSFTQETYNQIGFDLYPNPASTYLSMDFGTQDIKDLKFLIFDSKGLVVDYGNINTRKFTYEIPGYLASAYYTVIILKEGKLVGNRRFSILK
jgi:hypothetical protein